MPDPYYFVQTVVGSNDQPVVQTWVPTTGNYTWTQGSTSLPYQCWTSASTQTFVPGVWSSSGTITAPLTSVSAPLGGWSGGLLSLQTTLEPLRLNGDAARTDEVDEWTRETQHAWARTQEGWQDRWEVAEQPPHGGTPRLRLVEETPEQRQAREQEAAAAAERRREQLEQLQQERDEAEGRAEELLHVFLSPAQQEEYAQHRTITVTAPSGRRYRLRRMVSGGVQELDTEGRVVATLCIHPSADVPLADVLICQLHAIQNRETDFRARANRRAA